VSQERQLKCSLSFLILQGPETYVRKQVPHWITASCLMPHATLRSLWLFQVLSSGLSKVKDNYFCIKPELFYFGRFKTLNLSHTPINFNQNFKSGRRFKDN